MTYENLPEDYLGFSHAANNGRWLLFGCNLHEMDNNAMRHFRDVDATQSWMKRAINEDMVVPALAQAITGEIEAQQTEMAILFNTISTMKEAIRKLECKVDTLTATVDAKDAKIARMKEIVESLGLKAKVLRLLKEEF